MRRCRRLCQAFDWFEFVLAEKGWRCFPYDTRNAVVHLAGVLRPLWVGRTSSKGRFCRLLFVMGQFASGWFSMHWYNIRRFQEVSREEAAFC